MLGTLKDNFDDVCIDFIKNRHGRFPKINSIVRLFLRFSDDMKKDYVGQYAAQSAFFTALSAVPFLMIVILCLKYFVAVDPDSITTAIELSFPSQVSIYLSQIIKEVFYRSESITLSFTVVTALWASSRGTMAIYCGINQIYTSKNEFNWFITRVISFIYNIIMVAVIVATSVVLVFGNTLARLISSEYKTAHYIIDPILSNKFPIFLILLILAFAALYTFLPTKRLVNGSKPKFKTQLYGAAATAIGWILFSSLFSLYIEHIARYSVLYGSLSAIVLLMLWVYATIYMLLIGAEINKHIENGFFKKAWSIITYKPQKSDAEN